MGMIVVKTFGSFPTREKTFSAEDHGHARAVADAIKYLSEIVLPSAIRQDHDLHEDGAKPNRNFGNDG